MNKNSKEGKTVSRQIIEITNIIEDITGWEKEKIISWLKTNNILFQGESPTTLIMNGKYDTVIRYIESVKMMGKDEL